MPPRPGRPPPPRGIPIASFMVLQSWFFGSTALIWALATGTFRWSPANLVGLACGVLAFVATYSFLRSLQAPGGQVRVNAPIYRLNLVVTAGRGLPAPGGGAAPAQRGGPRR